MSAWSTPLRLSEAARGPRELELVPDEAERASVARRLGLVSLPALSARLVVRPWLDGAEIRGRFEARVEQTCGVSLEAFEQPVSGAFEVRVVPEGSPGAPGPAAGEMELDPEAPDPPDVLEGETVDLAEYVVQHLALELDPFPRKPGAVFEPPKSEGDDSPFAVLKGLKDRKG